MHQASGVTLRDFFPAIYDSDCWGLYNKNFTNNYLVTHRTFSSLQPNTCILWNSWGVFFLGDVTIGHALVDILTSATQST